MAETALSRIRKERGLSQSQLANKVGIHVQALARMERGDRPIAHVRFVTVMALADALEVDPHQFLAE